MPEIWPWGLILSVCLLYSYCKQKAKMLRPVLWVLLIILVQGHYLLALNKTLSQYGENTTITGQVTSFFVQKNHGIYFQFKLLTIDNKKITFWRRPSVNIFWPFAQDPVSKLKKDWLQGMNEANHTFPNLGQHWQLNVKLKPVVGLKNQVGFDRERYQFSQGWLKDVSVIASKHNRLLSTSTHSRYRLWQTVAPFLDSTAHKPHLATLSFGRRDFFSAQQWQDLKQTGLAHLMAISGLHIGLAFGLGSLVGYVIRLGLYRYPSMMWLPLYTGVIFAIFYAYLAGFSLPTIRALIMCLLLTLMHRLGLNYSGLEKILLSMLLVVILQPFSFLQAGFWLSFGAILCLWLGAHLMPPKLKQHPSKQDKLKSKFWRAHLIQVVMKLVWYQGILTCGLAGLNLFLFQGISASSPLVNLVLVPWASLVVVPLIFLSLLASVCLPSMAQHLWGLADKSVALLVKVAERAGFAWLELSIIWLALVSVPCLFYLLYRLRLTPYLIGFLAFYMAVLMPKHCTSCWQLDVFDVGHGLAVLIGKHDHWILYDTGNAWAQGSIASQVILPLFKYHGIKRLDGLIVSHQDQDHQGGMQAINNALPVGWTRTSWQDFNNQACLSGQAWQWQGLSFEVLWPNRLVKRSYNPHSCVVRIDDGQHQVLLTGDIDAAVEYLLLNQYPASKLKADVVIVPHHGSKTSSTQAFIQTIGPKIAIASLKAQNRWGLPSPDVVKRYQQNGALWLSTAQNGQVQVLFRSNSIQVGSLRDRQSASWYRQMIRKGLE
ncbi:MAG: DNA internalization-related competence protein ComEC/Rec2 [Vibrio sp.]